MIGTLSEIYYKEKSLFIFVHTKWKFLKMSLYTMTLADKCYVILLSEQMCLTVKDL